MIAVYVKPKAGFYRTIRESGLFSKKFCLMKIDEGLALLPGRSSYFKTGSEPIYHPGEILDGDFDIELKRFIVYNMEHFV
jgi:hypothetical protein